ncbi:hypothetical protein BH10BAC5_BH10BAC5_20230 [soil metagenome]
MEITYIQGFPDYSLPDFNMDQYIKSYLTSTVIVNAESKENYYPFHKTTLTIKSVFKGEEYYNTRNCRYRVKENNFLILNALQEYESRIISEGEVNSFSIFFSPDFVRELYNVMSLPDNKLLELQVNNINNFEFIEQLYSKSKVIDGLLTNIKNSLHQTKYNNNYLSDQLFLLLENLILMQSDLSSEINRISSAKRSTKIELYKRLMAVKDYIESCYNEKLTLAELSKTACMNEHYMLRQFKRYFKMTPYQYLTRVRLNRSETLLLNHNLSVLEISESVGFEYLSSFSQLFRKKHGISPSRFRKI